MKEIVKKVRLIEHLVSISAPLSGARFNHLLVSFPLSCIFLPSCHSVDRSLIEELSSLHDRIWVQGVDPFVRNTYRVPSLDNVSRKPGDQRVLAELYASIQKISDNPADYADPSRAIPLPFPSKNVVPPRFDLSGEGLFSYIGREKFTIIWEACLKIKADTRHRQAIYVCGTGGYGKSHILAALACLLVRKKEPVVYLPDCRAMLREPLEYLRHALLFAFVDSSSSGYRERIYECEDIEALAGFCKNYKRGGLCFIVDQLNALDPELKGEDDISDQRKYELHELLQRILAGHVLITSASANHKSAKYMASKDTGDQKIPLLGGMMTVRELLCIVILIR